MLTKVIATLGPASGDAETIGRMIDAGVRVFRINFSHGSFDDYQRLLENVRDVSEQCNRPIAVLGDLCGPKIRVGTVINGGIELPATGAVRIQTQPVIAGEPGAITDGHITISCGYEPLVDEVEPGEPVLLDDGQIELRCESAEREADPPHLVCRVVHGGLLTSRKGINLPQTRLSAPALTDYDRQCVEFAADHDFDFLALSFVRRAADVAELKDLMRELDCRPGEDRSGRFLPVIAKIEKPQALDEIESIVDEADGIMVARGDLAVEMSYEAVPVAQKRIIRLCHDYGKPVVVATQMLQSMIESPTPTRAEVSDAANAIFDGADAVMLSGETAVGRWPVEAVMMLRRVAGRANAYLRTVAPCNEPPRHVPDSRFHSEALARGVGTIVHAMDAAMVIAWFADDGSVAYLSRNRMTRPILAFSDNERALRRLCLSHGVIPRTMGRPASTSEFISDAERYAQTHGWAEQGDPLVFVLGEPITSADAINNIVTRRLGDSSGGYDF